MRKKAFEGSLELTWGILALVAGLLSLTMVSLLPEAASLPVVAGFFGIAYAGLGLLFICIGSVRMALSFYRARRPWGP